MNANPEAVPDDWKSIAAWLADRAIVAEVRGAEAFREYVIRPVAMNAVWRLRNGKPLSDAFKAMDGAGGDWWSDLPEASCDERARETWLAMRNRLMGALIDLECARPTRGPDR